MNMVTVKVQPLVRVMNMVTVKVRPFSSAV